MTDSPTAPAEIHPKWLRAVLEYGPLAIFLAGFLLFRRTSVSFAGHEWQGLVAATAIFVPAQVLATLAMWRLSGRLQAIQVVTLVLVVGLGGITLWLDDPDWIRMKPTLLYLLLAVLLGIGLVMGKSWLGIAFGSALQMDPAGWRILTGRFIMLCLALAAANEIVWRTMSEGFWLGFKLAVLPLAIFGFMMANYRLIQRHQLSESDDQG